MPSYLIWCSAGYYDTGNELPDEVTGPRLVHGESATLATMNQMREHCIRHVEEQGGIVDSEEELEWDGPFLWHVARLRIPDRVRPRWPRPAPATPKKRPGRAITDLWKVLGEAVTDRSGEQLVLGPSSDPAHFVLDVWKGVFKGRSHDERSTDGKPVPGSYAAKVDEWWGVPPGPSGNDAEDIGGDVLEQVAVMLELEDDARR